MYRNLFSPIRINTLEIKNRIAYPSLGLLYSTDGKLNDRYYNYFQERAYGGVGLVTVGPVGVDFIGSGAIALSLANDNAIVDFQKLTGIIKDGGGPGLGSAVSCRGLFASDVCRGSAADRTFGGLFALFPDNAA